MSIGKEEEKEKYKKQKRKLEFLLAHIGFTSSFSIKDRDKRWYRFGLHHSYKFEI